MDRELTNTRQARAWSGQAGAHWVHNTDRYDRMLAPFLETIVDAARFAASDRVLDIGCGTGGLTRAAARLAADGHATGVDISPVMIEAARDITDAEGPINASFEVADAQTYGFSAGGFDVLVSRFGLMFFDDPVGALANLHRAAVPGGRLVVTCWKGVVDNDWLVVPGAAAAEHVGMPDVGDPGAPGAFSFAEPDRLRQVLTDAGFGDIALTETAGPMWMGTDVDDTLDFFQGHEMVQELFEGKSPDAVAKALSAMRHALAPYTDSDGVTLAGRAWLVTARA